MKKFATSLFIYCGPLAYNFLHQNMPEGLPSLRIVQNILLNEYHPINEGSFRFQELLQHLNSYGVPKLVSIGEDATRLISRIDYDNETDRLVGFVLPCDASGLPVVDTYLAVSFDSIKESFSKGELAKYAFVYMAQPLSQNVPAFCLACFGTQNVPAFCLACFGTNNKFTAEHILKRWKYIFLECKKIGIDVVSFGADGDSRELKSVQVSSHLMESS